MPRFIMLHLLFTGVLWREKIQGLKNNLSSFMFFLFFFTFSLVQRELSFLQSRKKYLGAPFFLKGKTGKKTTYPFVSLRIPSYPLECLLFYLEKVLPRKDYVSLVSLKRLQKTTYPLYPLKDTKRLPKWDERRRLFIFSG